MLSEVSVWFPGLQAKRPINWLIHSYRFIHRIARGDGLIPANVGVAEVNSTRHMRGQFAESPGANATVPTQLGKE